MGLLTMGAGLMDVGTMIQGQQVDALHCNYRHCCGDDLCCGDDYHCYDDDDVGGDEFDDLQFPLLCLKNQNCWWRHSRSFSSPCHCWDGLGHQVIYRCENDLLVTITITIITITTFTIPRVQKSLLVLLVFAQVVKFLIL